MYTHVYSVCGFLLFFAFLLQVSDSDGRQLRFANIPTCELPWTRNRFSDRTEVFLSDFLQGRYNSVSPALACGTLSHQHSGKLMPVLTSSIVTFKDSLV